MTARESEIRRNSGGLRERNKREKLARIKRAARELFTKKGFEQATAREICRRARVATGTLFLYARDKRDLLFLVFSDEVHAILEEGMARTRADMPLADALMRLFGRFLRFYGGNRELSKVIAGEFFYRTTDPPAMAALAQEYFDSLATLVERARARGELRTDIPVVEQVTSFFAHYAFHVQAWLAEALVDRRQTEQLLRRAIELQIEGLAPRRGPTRTKKRARLGSRRTRDEGTNRR